MSNTAAAQVADGLDRRAAGAAVTARSGDSAIASGGAVARGCVAGAARGAGGASTAAAGTGTAAAGAGTTDTEPPEATGAEDTPAPPGSTGATTTGAPRCRGDTSAGASTDAPDPR